MPGPDEILRDALADEPIDHFGPFKDRWGMFNEWYRGTHAGNDREILEQLKAGGRVTAALQGLADVQPDPLLTKNLDIKTAEFAGFKTPNPLDAFMAPLWDDPVLRRKLNLFGTTTIDRVHPTATVVLSEAQFRSVYSHARTEEATMDGMAHSDFPVASVMAHREVGSRGRCFYRKAGIPMPANSPPAVLLDRVWHRIAGDGPLAILTQLSVSPARAGIESDTIETLYMVRNMVIHREISYRTPAHNEVAKRGTELLEALLADLS